MIKQVNTLTNGAAATILTPSPFTKLIVIQNNGSGAVRLSFDGGSTFNDLVSNTPGTDPTPTTGYLLAAGSVWTSGPMEALQRNGIDESLSAPIRAILASGTPTTLDILTDENSSS